MGFLGDQIDINAKRQYDQSDSVFASYIQSFEEKGRQYFNDPSFQIGDIPINFGIPADDSYKGVCYTYPDNTKEIIIDQAWWSSASHEYREALLFHELGHCRLNRRHQDEIIASSFGAYKSSLMNAKIVVPREYAPLKEEYLRELFTTDISGIKKKLGQ